MSYEVKHVFEAKPGFAAVFLREGRRVELESIWAMAVIYEEEDGEPCFQVASPMCVPPMSHGWGPTVLIPAVAIDGYRGMCFVGSRMALPKRVLRGRGKSNVAPKLARHIESLLSDYEAYENADSVVEKAGDDGGKLLDLRPKLRIVSRNRVVEQSRSASIAKLAESDPNLTLREAMQRLIALESDGTDE